MYIYTYLCTNGACRNIERKSGMKVHQIKCPVCGFSMNLIQTERI